MAENLSKVCSILDKLMLETLMLIEKYIDLKINLETTMCDGEAHLAKSRYIMGQNCVSALQLPIKDSAEFPAIATVHSHDDGKFGGKSFDLEFEKNPKNENGESFDPLRWFGILVPQDLHRAQMKYKQAVTWSVECANLQMEIHQNLVKIKQLKDYKLECSTNKEE
ncbi:hypothetical protein ILUMI_26430 [Ignelater luminosus]|uniref:Vacuolar ATPase assembly protein VMA22 n=1 Tax=Ignelater luminosus TaxID=2038154 RepID=A0A8K0C4C0_IGNLU|nr:hypothetical protein ILUMI_26430 [Ignelater luminosus]